MSCHREASQIIREAGYRLTPQRLYVLEAVYHLGDHVTADQVLAYVQQSYPHMDLSTVYRTLELLATLGLIRQFTAPNRPNEYEVATTEPHHHLVCRACGKVETVPAEPLTAALRRVLAPYGFVPEPAHMAVHGLCAECVTQDKMNQEEE